MFAKVKKILIYSALAVVGGFILLLIIGFWAERSEGPALFNDSFLSEDLPPPEPVIVTFTDADGTTHKVPSYSGEIKVLVEESVTLDEIKALVEKQEGKIVGQIIEAGIYLVKVPAGKENVFIDAILKEPKIIDAYPNFQFQQDDSVLIDGWKNGDLVKFIDFNGIVKYTTLPKKPGGIFGSTSDKNQGATHGELVKYFQTGKLPESVNKNQCLKSKECFERTDGHGIIFNLLEALKEKREKNYITVNISLSPGSEQGDPIKSATRQTLYRRHFEEMLRVLKVGDRAVAKTIVVNSAGNESLNLTQVFKDLASRHGNLDRLILVGALDENGNISDYSNYSTNPKDIIYVPLKEKSISGTSFTAPQITYLINKILDEYPELAKKPEKLKEILFHQSVATKKKEHYFIEDPYDPEIVKNALTVARDLLGIKEIKQEEKEKKKEEKPSSPPSIIPAPAPALTPTPVKKSSEPFVFLTTVELTAKVGEGFSYSFCKPDLSGASDLCGAGRITTNPTGGQPPYHFQVEGGFPPFGIKLNLNGILSGTPTADGERTFGVCAVDLAGNNVCRRVKLIVKKSDRAFNFSLPERLPSGKVKFDYPSYSFCEYAPDSNEDIGLGESNPALEKLLLKSGGGGGCGSSSTIINPSGGRPPYRFSVIGKLPDGLGLDLSDNLTGKPTRKGEYQFQICATDDLGVKVCKSTALVIEDTPELTFSIPNPLPSAKVGQFYSYSFEAKEGLAPYYFIIEGGLLPLGIKLGYENGFLTGIPIYQGTKNFNVCVRDSLRSKVCQPTSLVVSPKEILPLPPPPPPSPNCSDGKYNTCKCNDGKFYTCPQSDYYAECLSGGGAKCVSTAPPPPPTCPSGKTLCQDLCWSCNPGYRLDCSTTGGGKCIPIPGSITGSWSGNYTVGTCFPNYWWKANIVESNGKVSGTYNDRSGFLENAKISGYYYSDRSFSLKIGSFTVNGNVSDSGISGNIKTFCGSGPFSGQKN